MSQKLWRTEQIAAVLLFRYLKHIEIRKIVGSVCDFVVTYTDNNSNLRFGVEIVSSKGYNSEKYKEKLNRLSSEESQTIEYDYPIILLCVNELQETAKIGFMVGWRYGCQYIYKNSELRIFNQKNANLCIQIIKSMDKCIRLLSIKECKIIKTFSVNQAKLIYSRKFNLSYKMKEKKIVDEKEKFKRMLNGIPEDEFPRDTLDDVIQKIIKQKIDKQYHLTNSLFVTSVDIRDMQTMMNSSQEGEVQLVVSDGSEPDIPITIDLYAMKTEIITYFQSKKYSLQISRDEYNDIKKLLPTIESIKKYRIEK